MVKHARHYTRHEIRIDFRRIQAGIVEKTDGGLKVVGLASSFLKGSFLGKKVFDQKPESHIERRTNQTNQTNQTFHIFHTNHTYRF